jgi:hypothetical protein
LRSKKPSLPVLVLTPADSGGRPGPVPGHWRRRLSGQTILI